MIFDLPSVITNEELFWFILVYSYLIHIDSYWSGVLLQFCCNIYASGPLFNGIASCELRMCGLRGRYIQVKLKHLKLPKWWKLYSGYNTLVYFIPGESCYFFTLSSSCESLTFSSYSTLPRYLDVTLTARAFPRRIFQSIQRTFCGATAGGKTFWSTCSIYKPLTDHPDWQHTAHSCCLLVQSLESSIMWNHFPSSLKASSCVLQAAVYISSVLHYSWISTLR